MKYIVYVVVFIVAFLCGTAVRSEYNKFHNESATGHSNENSDQTKSE